ncbi:RNA polymerase sigma factor [Owenweeksia hongkongensis]|uniref:RNA polymerase sigma factor n=1 Tax=Owenweeksia hongkongensis TaxID=253245 RepID=UPI003A8ECEFC
MERQLQKTIKKCLKNDRQAQFDLYQLSFDHLMRTCRRYKRNREDAVYLVNDGFLKILLNLETYDNSRDFFAWASTIMVRTAIDDYRKNKTYTEETDLKDSDADLEFASLKKGHEQIIEQLTAEEIQDMIFNLPENERVVFNLYESEGYQHREIAEKLNVTERTTKRYLKAAKLKLKKMIEAHSDLKKVI